jgi:fructose-bisphosphate aldolase class II
VQYSHGGGQFNAGKFLDNKAHQASIAGSIAGALHVGSLASAYGVPVVLHTDHCAAKLLPWIDGLLAAGEKHFQQTGAPLFSSHMLDLSEEPLHENLETCRKYLTRMARIDMLLEIELGVTGGEEDGVDNSGVDNSKLYTQPSDVLAAYDALAGVGAFTVAAAFGNTHGVYAPGNVKLTPPILKSSQEHVQAQRSTGDKPIHFVFHGGSGSSLSEIREAVSYGVVKMNVDTDTQWAFLQPIKRYMDEKDAYLKSQLGNPEGPEKPNKKYIDPRGWMHEGEKGLAARVVQAIEDLGAAGKFEF